MRSLLIYLLTVIITTTLFQCANVTQPTGGPKDTIPPTLIQTLPQAQSLNFSEDEIILVFDEYIKVQNLKTKLIITPIFDDYDYKINKNSLTLKLTEPLLDNTTYTLNFTDAVEDITESNTSLKTLLSFSTGPYIDSVKLSGLVSSLMTQEPIDKAIVALYDARDTLNVFDDKPIYFTVTDENGLFEFQNLKNISYNIYAFVDANNTKNLQTSSEPYGFKSNQVNSTDTLPIEIPIQFRDVTALEIKRMRRSGKYYQISVNKSLRGYRVKAKDTKYRLQYTIDKELQTIRLYKPRNLDYSDSIEVNINLGDSVGFKIDTTAYISFTESKRKPAPLKVIRKPIVYNPQQKLIETIIDFTKPIRKINHDSIIINIDTLKAIKVPAQFAKLNNLKTQLTIKFPIALQDSIPITDTTATQEPSNVPSIGRGEERDPTSNISINMSFSKASFISIEKDTSKAFTLPIKIPDLSNTGILKGIINSEYSSFTIQLLDQKLEVVQELDSDKNYTFLNVPPGEYTIRVLIDANNDGRWRRGNITRSREPEPVYISPNKIIIKSNWELENDLIEF